MAKWWNKLKLNRVINKKSVKRLTRAEIKNKTGGFSKNQVLKRKKKVFFKIIKKQPYTFKANRDLKRISYELKLTFNRETNLLIKNHLQKTKEYLKELTVIEFNDFALNKDEVAYGRYGLGYFTDLPHVKTLKFKKIKEIVLTNQRLIFVFGVNKNSYYFSKYSFSKIALVFFISDIAKNKSTIMLYSKNSTKLFVDIKKLI